MSLGRSRKSNSILGLTYFKSTGSSGRQRHGRDIRADYLDFDGALGGDPKKVQDEAVPGCYMWIDQNGKKAMHDCKLLGSVSYNLSTSSKCALLMPCTNRPFKCKMPGCNMYVWTYSMKTHYADNHQGAET